MGPYFSQTGVFIRRWHEDRKVPCEDGGRDWSSASLQAKGHQGWMVPPEARKRQGRIQREHVPADTLILDF